MSPERAGLYLHIPFCLTRCGYCDFNTYAGLDHLKKGYVDALGAEAEIWVEEWSRTPFASVFFGGGTPTTLPAETLAALLDRLRLLYDLAVRVSPVRLDAVRQQLARDFPDTRIYFQAAGIVPGSAT